MVCFKEIKEYSGRKRINIINKDGFNTGECVAVLSKNDYESLVNENKELKKELETINDDGFDKLLEVALNPIVDSYEKQIKQLNMELKDKENIIDDMKKNLTLFLISFSGLSLLDVVFRSKHEELIKEFQDKIYIKSDQVAEVGKIRE